MIHTIISILLSSCLIAVHLPLMAQTLALQGAKVHTLSSQGSLAKATILIQDGVIVALGEKLDLPDDAVVHNVHGKVITPGLFDPLGTLGTVEISLAEETVDYQLESDRLGSGFDIADAINPLSTLIPINRIEGITRAMVAPKPKKTLFAGQGALIHLGDSDDYLIKRQAAVFVAVGEKGAKLSGGSRGGAIVQLREALQDAQDFAANESAFQRGERYTYAVSRPDLQALIPVVRGITPLVAYAERASDIKAMLRMTDEFPIKLVIYGAGEAWMVADKLAAKDVSVIIDPLANLPVQFESLGARLDNAALLHKAGVRVAFHTDDSHNARNIKQYAGNAVANGMPWEAALAAITRNPAEIWGVDEQLGTLEIGKQADLVVWDGDPLEVTTYADQVYIDGKAVPMVSRQTLLRDRYWKLDRTLPHAYQR